MSKLVFAGATIIDGVSDASFEGSLTIEDTTISAIGRTNEDPTSEVYDCRGMVICPGFIDSHCHLIYSNAKDMYDLELAKSIPEATIDAIGSARLLLSKGFTTIRDLGSRGNIGVAVRDAVADGRLAGPRIQAAGTFISTVGGLLDAHPSHIFEDGRYRYGHGVLISGPWEARDAVRRQVKDGVDWIKTETSGTGFNPLCPSDRDTVSEEELQAILDEARRKQRPVAVHAESRQGILLAAKAGARTIEHGVFLDGEGLDSILENGAALSPTLALYVGLADWGLDAGIPKAIVDQQRRTRDRHIESVQKAYEAGVTILAGSDAGVPGFPQGSCVNELEAYVEWVGMSPMEAMRTITTNPAKMFGLEELTGSLQVGRLADLVILSADPLADITILQEDGARVAVFKEGQLVAGKMPPKEK